ncbi:AT7L3 protein, partial [Podilymbus podiceps]|nr:AT7L3 protein [Podilymbus podiceps]
MKMEDMSLSGLDNSKLEAIAHEIYTDLVEDACLGLCFEVHRAVKCGYFFLDDTDPDSMKDFEIVDQPGVDIFGQVYNQWKNKECVCPNCSRSIAASRFAPHLENCGRCSPRCVAGGWEPRSQPDGLRGDGDTQDLSWPSSLPTGLASRPGTGMLVILTPSKGRASSPAPHWGESPSPGGLGRWNWSGGDGTLGGWGPGAVVVQLFCLLTRPFSPQQCGVISEHTKKMCTRSLRCPQHTDEQRRSVRVYLLGPSASLPEAEGSVENDSFEVAESQAIMSRLQWDGSSDISPSDSASSKASDSFSLRPGTNNSESRKTKKKKPHLGLVSGAPGLGSSKKKKPKPPAPHTPSIYDDIN